MRIYKFFSTFVMGASLLCFSPVGFAGFFDDAVDTIGGGFHNAGIVTQIKAKYARDKQLDMFDIEVHAKGNTVYLSGEVRDDLQYQRAAIIPLMIDGVEYVVADELDVRRGLMKRQDLYILTNINAALVLKELMPFDSIGYWSVKINVHHGDVKMRGTVATEIKRERIIHTVKHTPKVRSIKEDIKVIEDNYIGL